MNPQTDLAPQLEQHLALYHSILKLVDQENHALRQPDPDPLPGHRQARIDLLPVLIRSLDELKALRQAWQSVPPAERARCHNVGALLRQSQDVVMKVILMDRENEQFLLRRGLFPAREMSRLQSAPPHFAAHTYARQHNFNHAV
jgi:hypothetical protein